MKKAVALFATLAILAACSGGGSGSGTNGLPSAPHLSNNSAVATFVVKIPAKQKSTSSRHPNYITSSVQAIDFTVTQSGSNAQGGYAYYPLTPQSTYCATGVSGLTCTLQVNAPPGSDTFTVNEYDNATEPGLGYLVATGTLTQTINANASNVVNIITNAVPIFIMMGIDEYPATGSPATLPLSMTASDADGNIIIGQFNGPITLSTSPSTSAITFSKTTLNTSSDFTGLTVTYDGTATGLIGLIATPTFVNGTFLSWSGGTTNFWPGSAGVVSSSNYLYFAHANSAAQQVTISAVNGATSPFTMTTASNTYPQCTPYATVSGTSPTFTITPTASTFSGTALNTVGFCYVDVLPSTGQGIRIPVMISP